MLYMYTGRGLMTKVLLIDDNALVGKMVTDYLSKFDCDVEFACSSLGVINMIRTFSPDVILLDINMPGLHGDSIARLLQENRGRLKPFKLIFFSSEDEVIQKDLVEKSLADGYILKNGSVEGLEKVINNHLFTSDRIVE